MIDSPEVALAKRAARRANHPQYPMVAEFFDRVSALLPPWLAADWEWAPRATSGEWSWSFEIRVRSTHGGRIYFGGVGCSVRDIMHMNGRADLAWELADSLARRHLQAWMDERRREMRGEALDELAAQAQGLGMGY